MLLNVINTIAVAMTVTIVIWYLILVFDIDMGLWYSLNYSVKTFLKKKKTMCIMSFDCYKYDYYLIIIIFIIIVWLVIVGLIILIMFILNDYAMNNQYQSLRTSILRWNNKK